MDKNTALAIARETVELIGMCATFQAEHGRHYVLKPGSHNAVWEAYNQINAKQTSIAELLDDDAVEDAYPHPSAWWESQDIPDVSTGNQILDAASRLIACCAYCEASNEIPDWSYSIFSTQSVIAGLLQPAALLVALDNRDRAGQRHAG